jgi:hypothetical protein
LTLRGRSGLHQRAPLLPVPLGVGRGAGAGCRSVGVGVGVGRARFGERGFCGIRARNCRVSLRSQRLKPPASLVRFGEAVRRFTSVAAANAAAVEAIAVVLAAVVVAFRLCRWAERRVVSRETLFA